nr:hypothetical protein CFP56_71793 [Quercus suber]
MSGGGLLIGLGEFGVVWSGGFGSKERTKFALSDLTICWICWTGNGIGLVRTATTAFLLCQTVHTILTPFTSASSASFTPNLHHRHTDRRSRKSSRRAVLCLPKPPLHHTPKLTAIEVAGVVRGAWKHTGAAVTTIQRGLCVGWLDLGV